MGTIIIYKKKNLNQISLLYSLAWLLVGVGGVEWGGGGGPENDWHFQRSKSVTLLTNTNAVYKHLYTGTNVDLNLKHQIVTQFFNSSERKHDNVQKIM